MEPAFWTNLPAIIAAVMGGVTAIIAAIGNRRINANTAITVGGQQEVVAKLDSATKSVKQDALLAVKVAKTESDKVLGLVADSIIGGPGGLGELTLRVATLEKRFYHVEDTMNRILVVVSKVKATATGESTERTM